MPDSIPYRRIHGSCHCGNIRFTFDWPGAGPTIPVRACGCGLCTKHGGVWTSHPQGRLPTMSDSSFRGIDEEIMKLLSEISGMRGELREIAGRINRIESRVKKVFPIPSAEYAKRDLKRKQTHMQPGSLTREQALRIYDEMVDLARNDQASELQEMLDEQPSLNLQILATELGLPISSKRPSRPILVNAIFGRIRESVLLSKHTTLEKDDALDEARARDKKT